MAGLEESSDSDADIDNSFHVDQYVSAGPRNCISVKPAGALSQSIADRENGACRSVDQFVGSVRFQKVSGDDWIQATDWHHDQVDVCFCSKVEN